MPVDEMGAWRKDISEQIVLVVGGSRLDVHLAGNLVVLPVGEESLPVSDGNDFVAIPMQNENGSLDVLQVLLRVPTLVNNGANIPCNIASDVADRLVWRLYNEGGRRHVSVTHPSGQRSSNASSN